ncbi:hypothetical protein ACIG87_06035 [Micromonospora sp. NPDC051925]|uniref:hypothetical protein n=1 Tax=Micromonospora sp. NPDC051925 TaxID=3364288 RepID=UPI0037C982E9
MAFRTWGRLLLTALGVSMLAGAGQLGIAYGFGIVRLTGDFTDVNRWPAQLAWVGWFAVTAAVVGAVLTGRLARREGLPEDTPVQLAISGAAALGALVVAPLCMQPARAAELSAIDPVWAVGICAVAGAVVGAGAASAVLLRPPLGWNVAMLGGALWLVALLSAAPGVLSTEPLRTVRLGVLEPAWLGADRAQRLAIVLLPVVALLAGAVTGGLARRRGHVPLIGGAAGAAGPVLLAFAYLTAGPGDSVDRYQLAPYYGAVIAVATGALGSVAAALLRWPLLPARPATTTAGPAGDGDGDGAIEPTDILAPLPTPPTPPGTTSDTATSADLVSDEPSTVDLSAAARTVVGPARTGATSLRPGDDDFPATVPAPASGWLPPDASGTGPTPAHWDWPDTPVAPVDRPVTRSAAPDGAAAGARPLAPAEVGAGPDVTEPESRLGPDGGPAGRTAPIQPTEATQATPTGPTPTEVIPAEVASAEQPEAVGASTGDDPVSPPKPRAKRTRRARPADTDAPVVPTGRADSEPSVGASGTTETTPTAGQPTTVVPTPASPDAGLSAPDPGTSPPAAAAPGSADAGVGAAGGTVEPAAGSRHVPPGGVESTPRPRHQLPDLSGRGSWLGTPHPGPVRTPLPFPEPDTTEPTSTPGPVSLRWEPTDTGTADPVDDPPVAPAPTGDAEQKPTGRTKGRRGLFRRNRPAEGESTAEPTADPVTPDEEYVDWVTGLSKPLADNEPERESGRRSLRTSGRHHRD